MKKTILIGLIAVVAIAGGWLGRLGYRSWKQEHLIRQAHYFLSKSDVKNAALCLQQAVESNPNNLEANRMFANLAEAGHSRNAILWRKRVVELEPAAAQNRLDLARAALAFGDTATANDALRAVNPAERNSAGYQKLAGALAWALNQYPEAESDYLEALRLEPANPVSEMDLAMIQMLSTNSEKSTMARASLERLSTNAAFRCQALRQLTLDAVRNGAAARALAYSDELLDDPQNTFADRLAHLELLSQTHAPRMSAFLSTVQAESCTNSQKAAQIAKWMCNQSRTADALAWITTLPMAIRTNSPVPLIAAEGYAALGRWTDLIQIAKGHDWKEFDFQRHALYARALRAENQPLPAAVEWRAALKESAKNGAALQELAKEASAWGWGPELDETLWVLADNFPMDHGAFLLLYHRLQSAGNTPGLQRLLAKTSAVAPKDIDLKTDLALVSLLLNPTDDKAHMLAHEIYGVAPKNPYILSIYAYSLFLQHRSDEALSLFNGLDSGALTNSAVAAYYGIILAESGKGTKARPYLDLASDAKLLPEERDLVKKARQKSG